MMLSKLKRKARIIREESAERRLIFGGLKKIAVVLLLVGMNWSGLAAIGWTVGHFNDEESSTGNVFAASFLDIVLSPSDTFASGLMYPGDSVVEAINLTSNGILPYQYTARAEILGGGEACRQFTMTATDGIYSYSGTIDGFASPASVSSGPEDWTFTFSLSLSAPPEVWGQSCFFKWVFSAWQTDFAGPGSGFYDTDERLGVLRIGKAVVLNEFLPNPLGLDNAPKPGGEWVELYNNSSISFDLNGWFIYDSTDDGEVPIDASHTIGGTVISPHGFLVVYRDGDSDFILNNNADSVRLFTKRISDGGILVDSYTYTMEKPEGFSYARIPDGVGAWVDPIPTPGGPNKLAESEESEAVIEELAEELVASASFSETLEAVADAVPEFIIGDSAQTDQLASESQEMTGEEEIITASGSFENIASQSEGQQETTEPAPVSSASAELLPESTPESSLEPSPEPSSTPEPPLDSPAGDLTGQATDNLQPPVDSEGSSQAGDESLIQTVAEPAIPVESITVETPTELALPPADPPAPAPEPTPAPVDSAPAAPAE